MNIFLGYTRRSRYNQAGKAAPEYAMELPIKSPLRLDRRDYNFIKPTITFKDEYAFELGGKKFEIYHTWGETWDHLMVWLPDEKILCSGDLYYASLDRKSVV